MSDLIFVPELGLISGKSQNFKVRLWYPQPPIAKLRLRTTSKSHRSKKPSPFTQTQHLLHRPHTKSPKKPDLKLPNTALEAKIQPRPVTISSTHRRKQLKDQSETSDSFFTTGLEVNLQNRPMTMAGGRRKLSDPETFVNLPSLQQRPVRPGEFNV